MQRKERYSIAVVRGDGIGPEVVTEGIKILNAAMERTGGPQLDFIEAPAGADLYRRTGDRFPKESWAICQEADAIFLGATGLPDVKLPDGTGISISWDLKQKLDLYASIRPIVLMAGFLSPLKNRNKGDIRFLIVRENTEGIYASRGAAVCLHDSVVVNPMVTTRFASERIVRAAFRLCAEGNGAPADGRKRVTCVDKSNVLAGFALFRKVFDEVGKEFPEIEKDYCFIDAAAFRMVSQPETFDVLVTENMHGDILSDLGAGLIGGLGFAPSGNIGDKHGMFEPAHGTAPTIAGRGIANPLATILSAAMMLKWLGSVHADARLKDAAELIERSVAMMVNEGKVKTKDMGGSSSTSEVGDAVSQIIRSKG